MNKLKKYNEVTYQQNYEQFRSLNQIMWQIPVLAMTLTGGLWFGVSKIDDNLVLLIILLLTACIGNLVLAMVLYRFRHVMGCYMNWLRESDPEGFVDAGCKDDKLGWIKRFCLNDKTVRSMFMFMLFWASACSAILLITYLCAPQLEKMMEKDETTSNYYNSYAVELANNYEQVDFESAYPFLKHLLGKREQSIIDIGSGSGRDAAFIAELGHSVVAVEPAEEMKMLAEKLHPNPDIQWIDAQLPELVSPKIKNGTFDIALISAVWMHLHPQDREASLIRIKELLKNNGVAFVTLRIGPLDKKRGMFDVSQKDFSDLALQAGFKVEIVGSFDDLLGRPDINWVAYRLDR